jgi:sulfite exporter TauE/SafE
MCSGFVLSQTASVGDKGKLARLLLPYHAGRITTYTALGVLAGMSFHFFYAWSGFSILRHFVLGLVAVVFLAIFAERVFKRFGFFFPLRVPAGCGLGDLRRLATTTGPVNRYILGVSLGLLPCPMIFAATMAAGATGSPLSGGGVMLAFGIGTMPALIGLTFASGNLLKTSPRFQDGLTLAALGVNGVILLTLAVG